MTGRSPFARFAATLVFEAKKFSRQRLPPLALLAVVLATVVAGTMRPEANGPAAGWQLLARILETTLPLASFFLVIIGTIAVNDEITSRAMRAVLIRPVSRRDVLFAKATVLTIVAVAFTAAAWTAAIFWVRTHGGFMPVTIEIEGLDPVVKFDVPTMTAHVRRIVMATVPPMLAAPLFGLLISVLVESGGSAVALGLFVWFGMRTLGAIESLASWFFPTYLDRPLELLGEIAAGVETNVQAIEALTFGSSGVRTPLLFALGFTLAALAVFSAKETRC